MGLTAIDSAPVWRFDKLDIQDIYTKDFEDTNMTQSSLLREWLG